VVLKMLYLCFVRKARRSPSDGYQPTGAGLVVHRLRDHVENNKTGGRPPRVFHPVKEVRRPIAALRSPPATALRVIGPDDDGRLWDPEQRVQQTSAEEDLNDEDWPVSKMLRRVDFTLQSIPIWPVHIYIYIYIHNSL